MTEENCHLGDFIIEFPNPDHPKVIEKWKGEDISNSEKDKIYKYAFSIYDSSSKLEYAENEVLRVAYTKAFYNLRKFRGKKGA